MIRRFNRYELKYLIHVEIRDAIIDDLLAQMRPDIHAGSDGSYRVASLYYDSPALGCFWAKIEGLKYRRKLRLRIYSEYGEADDQVAMAEIKQRINRTVQKRRVLVDIETGLGLCAGSVQPSWDNPQDLAVAGEIEFLRRSLQLEPTCVISYLRTAYEGGQYDLGLRITFDRELTCRGPQFLLGRGATPRHFAPPEYVIMEVKANDAVPLWVSRMLSRHGCQLRRISKYCAGIALLNRMQTAEVRLIGA